MTIQKKFSHVEWAEATYKQACFDFFNGKRIYDFENAPHAMCVAIAQFQQCAEKSMKAMVLIELAKRSERTKDLVVTHTVWRDYISTNEDFRGIKNRLLKALNVDSGDALLELENLAPIAEACSVNTEYPWTSFGRIEIPASYFNGKNELANDALRVARTVLQAASDYNSRLSKARDAARIEFGLYP